MFDSPIETVECIWVNICGCLIGFGHKSAEIHTEILLHTVDQLVRNAKNETLCVCATRDHTQTGCSSIGLRKPGCASQCYCLKFSVVGANFTKSKQEFS